MKILIYTDGFFPAKTYGGPPVSINNFCELVGDKIDCYILTGNHELKSKDILPGVTSEWTSYGKKKISYISDGEKNRKSFEKIVQELHPEWIYLNSLFSAKSTIPFLKICKKYGINTLLAPRGELCNGAFKKRYKKIPYLISIWSYLHSSFLFFQSTSAEETKSIKKILKVNSDRIFNLNNIPSFSSYHKRTDKKQEGMLKIVFFSRISPKKNLLFALQCLSQISCKIIFDIYGPLEDKDYWKLCDNYIKKLSGNIKVEYKGIIDHDDIYKVLPSYHLFFFPTLSENYGHVIAEALFSGLPVLISDQTPWTDVNLANCGLAAPLNETESFISYINYLASLNNVDYSLISQNAYSYVVEKTKLGLIKEQYLEVFNNV